MGAHMSDDDARVVMSEEATTIVARIAEAAMEGADKCAGELGATIKRLMVSVTADGVGDEVDTTAGGSGTELSDDFVVRQRQLFEMVLQCTRALGNALGYGINVVSLGKRN